MPIIWLVPSIICLMYYYQTQELVAKGKKLYILLYTVSFMADPCYKFNIAFC